MKIFSFFILYISVWVCSNFWGFAEAKRGGGGGGGSSPKSSRKKCNLRTEYWDPNKDATIVAVARMRPEGKSNNAVSGYVVFEQQSYRRPIKISGNITGLDASGKHGFYITATALKGCNWSTRRSGHYNPHGAKHGEAKSCWRHVGDLEQLKANQQGWAIFSQFDARVQLQGPTSVIGRQVVILYKAEDNTQETSERIACGVIALAYGTNWKITEYVTPKPEDGLAYFYGISAFVVGVLTFIFFCKQEYDRKAKNKYVFESEHLKKRHQNIVQRRRKY